MWPAHPGAGPAEAKADGQRAVPAGMRSCWIPTSRTPVAEETMTDPGASRRLLRPPEPRRSSRLDPAAASVTALRGRGPEMEALCEVLDRVAAGQPALALIEGEAGIGKTRLLDTVLEEAAARGMQVARGRAEELEQNRPFGLVAAAFGCVRTSDDPRRKAIADLLASSL